jgi:predicted ribosome quality control (RQC) complex YloA/Tae2 family protein
LSLDGAYLSAVKAETSVLIGGRIDKINEPTPDTIVISMRKGGSVHRLLLSAEHNAARVSLLKTAPENPASPPMFCMLMRKHLGGGRLVNIRQPGLERILHFDFEAINELGDLTRLTLACEVMGKYSNVILIDSGGKIIDSLRRIDVSTFADRMVLPGLIYELPPRPDRLDFRNFEFADFLTRLHETSGDTAKRLITIFEGISPILAREWIYSAYGNDDLSDSHPEILFEEIKKCAETLKNNEIAPSLTVTPDGLFKDFTFIEIKQYGDLMRVINKPSACELLEYFYLERDTAVRLKQRSKDLDKFLINTEERIRGRISAQTLEIEECGKRFALKTKGDLISANLYRMCQGDSRLVCENFYEEDSPQVTIDLDIRLTPPQNAQKFYAEYKKAETRERILNEQIKKGNIELRYIESVFDALTRTETEAEIEELRMELTREGYLKPTKKDTLKKRPKLSAPIKIISPDGFEILVGKNNTQNDLLTTKIAEKTDIWFHTKNITGSHVILRTNGNSEVPESTLIFAAETAAYYSKARNSSQVPVDMVTARYVKKPNGAKPGMVIFTNNRTLFVKPEDNTEINTEIRYQKSEDR